MSEQRFWVIMGVFLAIMGGIIGRAFVDIASIRGELSAYKDENFKQISTLTTSVSQVQSDVSWLKNLFVAKQIEFTR